MISVEEVVEIIKDTVPTVEMAMIDKSAPLREQGFDSLDMISIIFAIEERLNLKIQEEDIESGKLSSILNIHTYINSLK